MRPTRADVQAPVEMDGLPAAARLDLAVDHEDRHGQQDPGDPAQYAVEAVADLGVHQREAARICRQPARERRRPHPDHLGRAVAGHNDRSGEHFGPRVLVHGVRFAGEERFVHLEAGRLEYGGVRGDLIPGPQHQDVVADDVGRGDVVDFTLAQHPCVWGVKNSQPVQGLLRPVFLDDADHGVADGGEAEQGILPLPQEQQQEEAGADDCVEEREDVGPEDLPQAAAGGVRDAVGKPTFDPRRHLLLRKAPGGRPGRTSVEQGSSLAPAVCPHPPMVSAVAPGCDGGYRAEVRRRGCRFCVRQPRFAADFRG